MQAFFLRNVATMREFLSKAQKEIVIPPVTPAGLLSSFAKITPFYVVLFLTALL